MPRVPAHVATTRHLGAAYPLVSEAGLGHQGVLIGRDLLGGSFVYDPFSLYHEGVVTNPNMVVFGQIGRGKSSFVKSYLWRQAVFGRQAWVVDPKGSMAPWPGPGACDPSPCTRADPFGSTHWTSRPAGRARAQRPAGRARAQRSAGRARAQRPAGQTTRRGGGVSS